MLDNHQFSIYTSVILKKEVSVMDIADGWFTLKQANGVNLISSQNNVKITYSALFKGYILEIEFGFFTYYWRRRDNESLSLTCRTTSIVIPKDDLLFYPAIQEMYNVCLMTEKEHPSVDYSPERGLEVLLSSATDIKLELVRVYEAKILSKFAVQEYPDRLATTQRVYDRLCNYHDVSSALKYMTQYLELPKIPYIPEDKFQDYYFNAS